ncbi:MAG TPA: hypothetical protein VGQ02_10775 [Candidatus Limnocylindrales bacterium]|jgi:hypothetical protein|nr:hypothetical protein [Candidatus Limnocylindrales bacterium]
MKILRDALLILVAAWLLVCATIVDVDARSTGGLVCTAHPTAAQWMQGWVWTGRGHTFCRRFARPTYGFDETFVPYP